MGQQLTQHIEQNCWLWYIEYEWSSDGLDKDEYASTICFLPGLKEKRSLFRSICLIVRWARSTAELHKTSKKKRQSIQQFIFVSLIWLNSRAPITMAKLDAIYNICVYFPFAVYHRILHPAIYAFHPMNVFDILQPKSSLIVAFYPWHGLWVWWVLACNIHEAQSDGLDTEYASVNFSTHHRPKWKKKISWAFSHFGKQAMPFKTDVWSVFFVWPTHLSFELDCCQMVHYILHEWRTTHNADHILMASTLKCVFSSKSKNWFCRVSYPSIWAHITKYNFVVVVRMKSKAAFDIFGRRFGVYSTFFGSRLVWCGLRSQMTCLSSLSMKRKCEIYCKH